MSSLSIAGGEPRSVLDLVVAGFPAGAAVVEPVVAEADVELSLAENTVLLTFATFLDLLTLAAAGLSLGGLRQDCSAGRSRGKRSFGNRAPVAEDSGWQPGQPGYT